MRKLFLSIALVGLVLMVFAPAITPAHAAAVQKVFVCKYVGTPGVDETLQTGQNPIDVAVSTLPDGWSVGAFFTDQHGRSFVLAVDVGQPEPKVSECPTDTPPTTTTSTVEPTTTTTLPPSTTTSTSEPSTTTTVEPTTSTSTTSSPSTTSSTTTVAPTTTTSVVGPTTVAPTSTTSTVAVVTIEPTVPTVPPATPPAELPRTGAASSIVFALGALLLAVGALLLAAFGGRRKS